MAKNVTIALSGKGGVGKSTVSALLVKTLIGKGDGAVFAVDADPNACLADYLGFDVDSNLGSIREDIIDNISNIPAGMTKERWIHFKVHECIIEAKGVDLLEMGRPEGPGCYCYINNLIREYEGTVHQNYRYTVIDNEAGMEHLSRRSTQTVDYLLIVSDLTIPGLKAAARIRKLSKELNFVTRNIGLILNRTGDTIPDEIKAFIEKTELDVVGSIPRDSILEEYMLKGNSVLDLPDDSPAFKAISQFKLMNEL